VSDVVAKRLRTPLEFLKRSFDVILSSVCDPSKIESMAMECGVKILAAIGEKHGVVDGVFLAEFGKKDRRLSGVL